MNLMPQDEFLQGFFEEAEEHLQTINRLLLRLETSAKDHAGGMLDVLERKELFKDLHRSFHTLKGMSGMVGLKEAVSLSHAMETLLLALERSNIDMSLDVLNQLFAGTRAITEVVNAARSPGSPPPEVSAELERIQALLEQPKAELLSTVGEPQAAEPRAQAENETQNLLEIPVEALLPQLGTYPSLGRALGELEHLKINAAFQARNSFYLAVFFPSAERSERGENVDHIRAQIGQVGTLLKAVPDAEDGRMRFLFLFVTSTSLQPGTLSADEIIPLVTQPASAPEGTRQPQSPARQNGPGSIAAPLVRVELDRLEEMIRVTGDLMQLRARLLDQFNQIEKIPVQQQRAFHQTAEQMNRKLRDLRRSILRARMVPLAETFNQMPLVVRDIARVTQKEVRLVMRGETTEVDKLLVERLREPLIHLVRNAVIHGIEQPAERAAAGKSRVGTITLTGTPQGDHIVVEVADDGSGVNRAAAAAKAIDEGVIEPGVELDDEGLLALIVRAGFTTRQQADEGAGRGVGLDVVQRMVRAFGGKLSLQTADGVGTKFRLRLPLTMVILEVLLVQSGGERYAVPRNSVVRIEEIDPAVIVPIENGELLQLGEDYSRLHRLDHLMDGLRPAQGSQKLYGLQPDLDGVAQQEHRHLVVVDRVLELREVVVRTLSDPFVAQPGIAGATEMSDGQVVLILDLPALLQLEEKG